MFFTDISVTCLSFWVRCGFGADIGLGDFAEDKPFGRSHERGSTILIFRPNFLSVWWEGQRSPKQPTLVCKCSQNISTEESALKRWFEPTWHVNIPNPKVYIVGEVCATRCFQER